MKVVIVGGVAGGMSAATRLRRNDEFAEIVVFEQGPDVSFANCGLPYHLGGVIPERDNLLLNSPGSLAARFEIDVRTRHRVESIDVARRRLVVRDLARGTLDEESYDELILSVGAVTRAPGFPSDAPVHTLRDVQDLDALVAALDTAASVLVVGAGFSGLEVAENLARRELDVTVVSRGRSLLSAFDPEMVVRVEDAVRAVCDLRLGVSVERVSGGRAALSDGGSVPADVVFVAAGVDVDARLAREAGIDVGPGGGIVVDELQRTSAAHVWAVGDAAEKTDAIFGRRLPLTFAGLANREGRLVADAISGVPRLARPAIGTAIIGFGEVTAARTGWSESALRRGGIVPRVIHTHPAHHATYYPGARELSMKLLIDPSDDRILGAQVVGARGVDKRIDVIAAAMAGGLRASDLADLELAYAPQFGSAKDPVNILGYIAGNAARGEDPTIQWHELAGHLADGWTLIDVRSASARAEGVIDGARWIPLTELRNRIEELRSARVVAHCRVGQTSHTAQRLLLQHGIPTVNLDGGFLTWSAGQRAGSADAAQQ